MSITNALDLFPDLAPLPMKHQGRADLYLRFPAKASVDRARDNLRQAKYEVRLFGNPLNLCVADCEPLPTLTYIMRFLTPPEIGETLALLRPPGGTIEPADVLFAMNVGRLRDRLEGGWLVEVLQSHSLTSLFQPIFRVENRTSPVGYEALARGYWNGEEIPPSRMLDVARNAHLMPQLDALAMQTALIAAANSKIQGMLFLNCSPSHVYDPISRIAALAVYCEEVGMNPRQIVLEIVESEKNDAGHLTNFVRACRRHGFRVAMDDLGAGYSSLNVLSSIRPDILKMDRELITSIDRDPFRAIILNRLLDASRILSISTIVEGVETQAEFDWALTNGATYIQGNLLGKPAQLPT
jgi:EAL domain-containing protein (putative c-di-GMP-specific phosphodiesterase class I)